MDFGVLSPVEGEMAALRPEGVACAGYSLPSFMSDAAGSARRLPLKGEVRAKL